MNFLSYWLQLKWGIFEKTMTSVLLIIGLSATLTRYFRKLVHRYVAESPKLYSFSFWLQIVAVLYLNYIFVAYFHLGLISGHPFLKMNLIFVNVCTITLNKITMVEASQNTVLRNLAIVNFGYVSYLLTYTFGGYPWWTFFLYSAILFDQIICRHFVEKLSKEICDSIGIVFNDPENLDELVRLNINHQLDDTHLD